MPFAVEMFFDESADKLVRAVWDDLAREGTSSAMIDGNCRPHVSLSVLEQYSTPGFENELRTFAASHRSFPIKFDCLGIFPRTEGVVYFGAVAAEQLLSVHREFHHRFAGPMTGVSPYYLPGNWIPHCTLGYGLSLDAIPAAVAVCSRAMLPIAAQVKEISLVEFPGHREVVTCRLAAGWLHRA
jgi:2'-5' RNA ligase